MKKTSRKYTARKNTVCINPENEGRAVSDIRSTERPITTKQVAKDAVNRGRTE